MACGRDVIPIAGACLIVYGAVCVDCLIESVRCDERFESEEAGGGTDEMV